MHRTTTDSAALRSAARDAEMELDFARAAALYEAAIFHYPARVAAGGHGQRDLDLLQKRMAACRRQATSEIGHA
jgi:hypothetical protein